MHTEWLTPEEERIWRQWLRAGDLLTIELGRRLQPYGLGLPDYAILVHLTDQDDDRLRMSELAEAIQWDRSRLSHHIKRMVQRGLVERVDCAEDRRGAYVLITDAGRETIERAAPAHVRAVRDSFLAGSSTAELAELDHLTTRIIGRLAPEDAAASA